MQRGKKYEKYKINRDTVMDVSHTQLTETKQVRKTIPLYPAHRQYIPWQNAAWQHCQ